MENITLGNIQNLMVFVASMITTGGVIGGFIYRLINKKQKEQQELLKLEIQELLEPFNNKIDETKENNNKRFDEINKKFEELKKQYEELLLTTDKNDIDAVRSRISAFAQVCKLDVNYDKTPLHSYNTAFKDIDKWARYHKKYPELNGEINSAIEIIKEHYKKAKF